jgi:hypothetical protein
MQKCDKYGFPKGAPKLRQKSFFGFQTGDIVKAVVTKGKKAGTYIGRVAVRKTGSFNIKTKTETVQGISFMYCLHTHKSDGYAYQFGELVQQKVVNFVPQTTQLNLFDTSKLQTNTKSTTKKKSKTKSSGFDGEQLSLF